MDKPDIVWVARLYGIDLPKTGRDKMTCRCPFHNDKGRPNMVLYVRSSSFHCFNCNAGGDSWDLAGMMEYGSNWDKFNKKMFAELANKLSLGNTRQVPIRKEIVEEERELTRDEKNVIAWASRLYHFPIFGKVSDDVREYLYSRGIDKQLISYFQIGNALPGLMVSELMRLPPQKRDQILESCLFYKLEDSSYNSDITISNSTG